MLNIATITADYKTALEAGGADPASPFTLALAQGFANALINAMATATVTPGDPPPVGFSVVVMGAPTPVTGAGKVT